MTYAAPEYGAVQSEVCGSLILSWIKDNMLCYLTLLWNTVPDLGNSSLGHDDHEIVLMYVFDQICIFESFLKSDVN